LTVAVGVGGSYVAGAGGEGSGGVYINPSNVDAGGFLSGGTGLRLNISGSVYVDFVTGDVSNFASPFTNINSVWGPISITNHYSDGQWQGISFGAGPGFPIGTSVTWTNTISLAQSIAISGFTRGVAGSMSSSVDYTFPYSPNPQQNNSACMR
jgi:hypothetical protein